jgi:dihydropyrimidine dehydrogenase (NAD+) subunit PreA
MGAAAGQEPRVVEAITSWAKEYARIPVIAKLTPNVTDIVQPALAACRGGADAFSLINTLRCVIGVDLETLSPLPSVKGRGTSGGLSGPAIKPIALAMVAQIASHRELPLPISGIGGISSWQDVAEFILLGASTVQVCTAVMLKGFSIVEDWIEGLSFYGRRKGLKKLEDMVGLALERYGAWGELDTAHQVVAKVREEKCKGCGICVTACSDGGHQALSLQEVAVERLVARVDGKRCQGCGLCLLVCPHGALDMVEETQ